VRRYATARARADAVAVARALGRESAVRATSRHRRSASTRARARMHPLAARSASASALRERRHRELPRRREPRFGSASGWRALGAAGGGGVEGIDGCIAPKTFPGTAYSRSHGRALPEGGSLGSTAACLQRSRHYQTFEDQCKGRIRYVSASILGKYGWQCLAEPSRRRAGQSSFSRAEVDVGAHSAASSARGKDCATAISRYAGTVTYSQADEGPALKSDRSVLPKTC